MAAEELRFQLERSRWYACEFIGDEFDEDLCSYSPIKILGIEPLKQGNSTIVIKFYHANYPEGVRDKVYKVRIIKRGMRYILGKSLDHETERFLQIYDIDSEWVKRHFPYLEPSRTNLQSWLSENI